MAGTFCDLFVGGADIMVTYKEYLNAECSMTLEEMQSLHGHMIADIGTDADAIEIYNELAAAAARYAGIRAGWLLLGRQEKMELDPSRTSCHDSVIIKFNMLARYLKTQGKEAGWRGRLGDEKENPYARKRIGDFACYISFVNSLNAR